MVLPLIGIVVGAIALIGLPLAMVAATPNDDEMESLGELASNGLYTIGWLSEGIFYGAIKALPPALIIILLFNFAGNVSSKVVGEEL